MTLTQIEETAEAMLRSLDEEMWGDGAIGALNKQTLNELCDLLLDSADPSLHAGANFMREKQKIPVWDDQFEVFDWWVINTRYRNNFDLGESMKPYFDDTDRLDFSEHYWGERTRSYKTAFSAVKALGRALLRKENDDTH